MTNNIKPQKSQTFENWISTLVSKGYWQFRIEVTEKIKEAI